MLTGPWGFVWGQGDAVRVRQCGDTPRRSETAAMREVELANFAGTRVEQLAKCFEVRHPFAGGDGRGERRVDLCETCNAFRPARLFKEVEPVRIERSAKLQSHRRRRTRVAIHHDVNVVAITTPAAPQS